MSVVSVDDVIAMHSRRRAREKLIDLAEELELVFPHGRAGLAENEELVALILEAIIDENWRKLFRLEQS